MMNDLLLWIGGGAIIVAGWLFDREYQRRLGQQEGKSQVQVEAARDVQNRTEKGRQAVQTGRDSGGTPDERLRRNDGNW